MQLTIEYPVSCYGVGVHSGKLTQLTLKPALENTGITFIRTDIQKEINIINATPFNVSDTKLSTTIKNPHNISVSTIEHLMAAIWGCNIDNMIIEIDGPEIPVMDGSSRPFVFMIEYAGRVKQKAHKKYLKILKEVKVEDNDAKLICYPSDIFSVHLTINFLSKAIGTQSFIFSDKKFFKQDIANARTFGFVQELDYLRSKGFAQGASLENAIGIDKDQIINPNGLRHKDEFVRHKLLDLFGDLYTTGINIIAEFNGYKTSHTLNNKILRAILSDKSAYKII